MEDAIAAFQNRRSVARCQVHDLERERTGQALLIRELRRGRGETAEAEARLYEIGEALEQARIALAHIEEGGVTLL